MVDFWIVKELFGGGFFNCENQAKELVFSNFMKINIVISVFNFIRAK
jgi:hypothetical protein